MKADREFLLTDAFQRLQHAMKNITLNNLNIIDQLQHYDVIYEETTLAEALLYTLAYWANLNILHFSFSLLIDTYKEECIKLENEFPKMNVLHVYLGDRADLWSFDLRQLKQDRNYSPEFIATIQSLITLDHMNRNQAKMILTPLEDTNGFDTTTERLIDRIVDELKTMKENKEEEETDTEIISIN